MSTIAAIRAALANYRAEFGSLALWGEFFAFLTFWLVAFVSAALLLAVGP